MHSPLRIKIQNAINKALQLETTDVLFVGGRRRNRKRKRKHGKDKRKSKKYEGKETPVLKAKTHNGSEGRYIALLAEDDISLSPSMIDDLLDGTTSIDAISINQGDEGDEQEEECAFDDENDNTKETKEETSEIDVKEKKNLQKEEIDADCTELTNDEERPSSCDTGYNSEEEHKISEDTVISTDEIKDEEHMEEIMVDDDDVFVCEDEDSELDNSTFVPEKEITKDEGIVLTKPDIFEDVSLENENNEGIEENADLDQTTSDKEVIEEEEEDLKEESSDLEIKEDTLKAEIVCPSEKFSVEDLYTEEPRVTINFDCEEEEEEEIYTKQPKPWYSSKTEEDEERRPLICCGDDNGVGYACCTIL